MKLNTGMRCHDLCPKMEMEKVFAQVKANNITQIQLAFQKSISNYDFSVGHYSAGLARYVGEELKKNNIHVAILGCYINPINPIEEQRKAEVARFIEHLKYAKMIGADMVGTETGRFDPEMRVTKETFTEDAYRLFLKSMEEIASAAEKLGVMVGIEGVYNHTIYSPGRMKRFLDDIQSPNVEVIMDSVNLLHPDEVEPEAQQRVIDLAFDCYGERITMLHVKDFVFEGDRQKACHVGDGLFQYEPLMRRVKEQKPHITMLFENSSRDRYHQDVEFIQKVYDRV